MGAGGKRQGKTTAAVVVIRVGCIGAGRSCAEDCKGRRMDAVRTRALQASWTTLAGAYDWALSRVAQTYHADREGGLVACWDRS